MKPITLKIAKPANTDVPLFMQQTKNSWLREGDGEDGGLINNRIKAHFIISSLLVVDLLVEVVVEFVVRAERGHGAESDRIGEEDLSAGIYPDLRLNGWKMRRGWRSERKRLTGRSKWKLRSKTYENNEKGSRMKLDDNLAEKEFLSKKCASPGFFDKPSPWRNELKFVYSINFVDSEWFKASDSKLAIHKFSHRTRTIPSVSGKWVEPTRNRSKLK